MDAAAFRHQSLGAGNIRVQGGATEWVFLLELSNAVGTSTTCGIQLARRGPGVFVIHTNHATNGACAITVTRAAPNIGDEVEGTFSGVVHMLTGGSTGTPPITITNGRFRAVRGADQSGVGG